MILPEPNMCCWSIVSVRHTSSGFPTSSTSSLTEKPGSCHVVPMLPSTLKGLIKGSAFLLNNLNPSLLRVYLCLYKMLAFFPLFLRASWDQVFTHFRVHKAVWFGMELWFTTLLRSERQNGVVGTWWAEKWESGISDRLWGLWQISNITAALYSKFIHLPLPPSHGSKGPVICLPHSDHTNTSPISILS